MGGASSCTPDAHAEPATRRLCARPRPARGTRSPDRLAQRPDRLSHPGRRPAPRRRAGRPGPSGAGRAAGRRPHAPARSLARARAAARAARPPPRSSAAPISAISRAPAPSPRLVVSALMIPRLTRRPGTRRTCPGCPSPRPRPGARGAPRPRSAGWRACCRRRTRCAPHPPAPAAPAPQTRRERSDVPLGVTPRTPPLDDRLDVPAPGHLPRDRLRLLVLRGAAHRIASTGS